MPRSKPPPRGPQLDLAGSLPVAFVNTASARDDNRQKGVRSYLDLLAWSQQVGLVSAPEAERLQRRASEQPDEAAQVFARVAAVRSCLFRIFLAQGTGRELPHEDFAAVNEALGAALPALRLVPAEQGVAWGFTGDENALDRMLWPILFETAELLISARGRPHVRQCALKECRLFFLDRTPSAQRRWCEMKTCGNRAKARQHQRRRRARAARSFSF